MICEKAEERSGQAQFVICDVQREYAENLMNIISEKLKEEYQFHLFWNLQQLKEFSERKSGSGYIGTRADRSLFADPSDREDQICYSYCEAVGKKCPGIIPESGRELRR